MRNGTHLSNRYREREEKREREGRGERENEDLFVRHSFEGIAKIALRV
jgi:hypothetical protein